MAYTQDAADKVVSLALNGMRTAAVIVGRSAARAASLLYSALRSDQQSVGKTRLSRMVRDGRPLKVFSVLDEDLERFCREARRYGVSYCVLKDRTADDGMTDILVRSEDAGKINRIYERFRLAVVDTEEVLKNINRARKQSDLFRGLEAEESNSNGGSMQDPAAARSGGARRSGREAAGKEERAADSTERPSVRRMLDEIKAEREMSAPAGGRELRKSELAMRAIRRQKER